MSLVLIRFASNMAKDFFMLRISLWVVCLAMASAALAAPPEGLVHVQATWKMSLDPNGKVTALVPKPGRVKDVLRKVLETAVLKWEFVPGSVNGKQAETETNLIVSISLWPTADGESYSVKVDDVQTGGGLARIGKMPTFSRTRIEKARQDKINPVVLLEIIYDEYGKPSKVVVADRSPVKNGSLVTEAIKAVRTWTFEPERVAGHGIEARAILPICYRAVNVPGGGDCIYPSEIGDTPFESGSSIALESSVTLKSDVIGKTL